MPRSIWGLNIHDFTNIHLDLKELSVQKATGFETNCVRMTGARDHQLNNETFSLFQIVQHFDVEQFQALSLIS